MKKLSILLLGMAGLIATSCDDKIEPSMPQQNPQQPILTVDDISSEKAGVLATEAVIDLENYNEAGAMIPVMKLVKADSMPNGATVSYKLEISPNEDFSRSIVLNTEDGEGDNAGTYFVSAEAWNDAHVSLFGKSPKEKTAYYRVPVYIDLDGSNYRLNGLDYYAATGTVKETCFDLGFVIEDHYYFMSNSTTWDFADAKNYAFEHPADVSVYDDPVFKIKFEVTQAQIDANGGGSWWKIAPESAVDAQNWDGLYGTEVNGDESLSGHLFGPSKDVQSGKLTQPGKYELTINMEAMTYSFELKLQPDVLYTPGDTNGWNQLASAWLGLSKGAYYGVSPLATSGFKICAEPKWDNATDYGAVSTDPALSGDLVLGQGGANINAGENGVYWIKVDFDPANYQMTKYQLTKINRVGVIGGFAASGWGSDVEMTTADEGKTWTAEITFADGDEFKIRFNESWDYNLGGNMDALLFDEGNVKVEKGGDYVMTLSLLGGLPKVTLTAK